MEQKHKDILQKNRVKLLENIEDIKLIVDKLFSVKTITKFMKDDILAPRTKADQIRNLLDKVPTRGPAAFEKFYTALVECEEWEAAELLKPGEGRSAEQASKSTPQPDERDTECQQAAPPSVPIQPLPHVPDDLPKFWPDNNYSPLDIQLKPVDQETDQRMQNMFVQSGLTNSEFYCLQNPKRGKLVIINNEKFSEARDSKGLKLDDRTGTEVDATSLELLFDKLYFSVEAHPNLKASEIVSKLQAISQEDHIDNNCFAAFILSHGCERGVYGTDGEVVNVQALTDLFNSRECPSLAGKPKLFFIQACQGKKDDTGSAGAAATPSLGQGQDEGQGDSDLQKAQDEVFESLEKLSITESKLDSDENHPTRSDIFVAFATTPEYASYREKEYGTWFVQAISYIFQRFAHEKDLLSLMTKVNQLVGRGNPKIKNKQGSNFNSSFRKTFYFFPGLPPKEFSF